MFEALEPPAQRTHRQGAGAEALRGRGRGVRRQLRRQLRRDFLRRGTLRIRQVHPSPSHQSAYLEPTHGHIFINGEDVGALSPEELRVLRRIGMVFQNMALLPHRTVQDNIAFALDLRNADTCTRHQVADRAIETVSLQGYGDRMQSEISGGLQWVWLARALSADPEVLLMEEPFAALEPLIRRGLQDEFLELSRTMRKTTSFLPTTSTRRF